ncbi:hypothetical protein [Candidatus Nanohalococcus occultus]|uniref:hypothetical protein n=1 Tax=Candidatus Nanohalococcus occultus TaxID=2978047 RepID=UPI0039E076F6
MSNQESGVIEGLVPDNVRTHSGYEDSIQLREVEELMEESGFPQDYTAVMLGNPDIEAYTDALGSFDCEFGRVLVNDRDPELYERDDLFDNIEAFSYEGESSRAAELAGLKEAVSEDEPLVLLPPSYNVQRTSIEAGKQLGHSGVSDGYLLEFPDFPSMSVNGFSSRREFVRGGMISVPGGLPFSERINEAGSGLPPGDVFVQDERSFEYEFNSPENEYIVAGVPVTDDRQQLRDLLAAERFKNWAGQSAKDKAKKIAKPLSENGLDY